MLHCVSLLCATNGKDVYDLETAKKNIDDSIKLVGGIVKQEKKDPAFSLNRFFKDAETKERISIQVGKDSKKSKRKKVVKKRAKPKARKAAKKK